MLQLGTLALVAACQKKEPLPSGPVNAAPKDPDGAGATVSSAAATPLPKRKLGRTGVEVSVLGLGGFHMGQEGSVEDSVRLVRTAIDEGITFLDNCWDYNQGNSESRMGKALADGYRKRVYLMTKIDGRTKQSALAQLEQSLQRLNTDVIDLVQIHEVIRPNDPDALLRGGRVRGGAG